jgi:hypothetical protein
MRFLSKRAEDIRLRSLYRDFAMRGEHGLGPDAVKGLVGPDCTYHLYRNVLDKPGRSRKR